MSQTNKTLKIAVVLACLATSSLGFAQKAAAIKTFTGSLTVFVNRDGGGSKEAPSAAGAPAIGTSTYQANAPYTSQVQLLSPEDLNSSFAADLNSSLMSDDAINAMEREYKRQLQGYQEKNGLVGNTIVEQFNEFQMRSEFLATSRDSRSIRPVGWSPEAEAAMQAEYAQSIKHYMIIKGIPNFLKTREDTKKMAEQYEGTIKKISDTTQISVKSENRWAYSTGVNVFESKFWSNAENEQWKFEAIARAVDWQPSNLQTTLYGVRKFHDHSFDQSYHIQKKIFEPGYNKELTKNLRTRFSIPVPLASQTVLRDTSAQFALKYAF